MEVTWESAASLPPAIIEKFGKGIHSEAVTHTDVQYGQQKRVLSVSSNKPEDAALKWSVHKSTGYVGPRLSAVIYYLLNIFSAAIYCM